MRFLTALGSWVNHSVLKGLSLPSIAINPGDNWPAWLRNFSELISVKGFTGPGMEEMVNTTPTTECTERER